MSTIENGPALWIDCHVGLLDCWTCPVLSQTLLSSTNFTEHRTPTNLNLSTNATKHRTPNFTLAHPDPQVVGEGVGKIVVFDISLVKNTQGNQNLSREPRDGRDDTEGPTKGTF